MNEDDRITIHPEKPWEILQDILKTGNSEQLKTFLDSLTQIETALAISRLEVEEQTALFSMLDPSYAADVFEGVPEEQAADIMEELTPTQAAAIIDEMESDHQADILAEMDDEDVEAILSEMEPDDAEETRAMLSYPPDSAGGVMINEYLAYPQDMTITEVLEDLHQNRESYVDYQVQYIYCIDGSERLTGVLRIHDLLFAAKSAKLRDIMIRNPLHVLATERLEQLQDFFDEHELVGVPVTDEEERLVGVILPQAIEEAVEKRTVSQFLDFTGIVGGEEFRSMSLWNRSGRRLSWLSINIILNIIAASVIVYYQETLAGAIALAVFLPIISDMCGCSGNQAVAVSMRELTLGLVRPREVWRVLGKEISIGLVNGLALGLLLAVVAMLWKGNYFLGLVVGAALMANTIVSVSLGGILPLVLKRLKLDPALVASPVLTTVTDMCGFFFVLSFATLVLAKLG
ncbi:magnesium transporter [candidate division KSB1 bacterium]|nr:magnesium transporter [candidate division KSB1 bacterium]